MSARREITNDIKKVILSMKNDGKSLSEISKIINRPRSSIQTVLRNFNNTGTIENKPRSALAIINWTRPKKNFKKVKKEPKISAVKYW